MCEVNKTIVTLAEYCVFMKETTAQSKKPFDLQFTILLPVKLYVLLLFFLHLKQFSFG